MTPEEHPFVRRGSYTRPDEPSTLYGVEEPEQLPSSLLHIELPTDEDDASGPPDRTTEVV